MSLAAAPRYEAPYTADVFKEDQKIDGAQTLLNLDPPPPNYVARIGAIAVYALALAVVVTVGFKTIDKPVEDEQAIELAPIPTEEPPVEDTPPQPEELDIPDIPPPLALDPIAPVEDVKPVEKPKVEKPKPEKPRVEKKETRSAPPASAAAPAVHAPPPAPGVATSAIANQFHACIQRGAGSAYPESQAPRTARIAYRATFSATGQMTSFSITPSGNGAFDAVANRLGSRCSAVAAPGKPVSLSGGFVFSP